MKQLFNSILIFTFILILNFCAQYNVEPGYLGLLLLSNASGSSNNSSPVKRVLSGNTIMDNLTKTATIDAVDMARSFVLCYGRTSSSSHNFSYTCQLASSTEVTLSVGAINNQVIHWYVVEFASGASVQRGTIDPTTTTALDGNIGINPIDTSKSFPIITSRTTDASRDKDEQRLLRGYFINSSNLNLSRSENGIAISLEWQVVSLDGANVKSDLYTLSSASASVPISSIEPSRSFLLFNYRPNANVNGIERRYLTRGSLSSSQIDFTRGDATDSVDISYYVVELQTGTKVQSGSVATAVGTDLIEDEALSPAIDTNYTIPVISTQIVSGADSDGDFDSGSYSAEFNTTSNLRLERVGPDGINAAIDWFAIHFISNQ